MKTKIIMSIALLGFLFSCQSDSENHEKSVANDVSDAIAMAGKTAEEFEGKLDELLTIEMASKASCFDRESAKKDYTKAGSFESLKYVWKKTNRTRRIEFMKGNFIDAPVEDRIELSWVKNTTLDEFKRNYHALTKQELANAEAAMNEKLREMQTNGKTTKSQTEAAASMAKASLKGNKVTVVSNVGDYSVFVESYMLGAELKDLKVFYKGLSFTINVDLSNDQDFNDKKAIEVTRMIIDEKLK